MDTTVNLSNSSIVGRAAPDAPAYQVLSISGDRVIVASPPVGIAAGDEVAIITVRGGRNGATRFVANVGHYDTVFVVSVDDNKVVVHRPLLGTFGATDNADLTNHVVELVRIPHYGTLDVVETGVLTVAPFQPQSDAGDNTIGAQLGGVLFLRISEILKLADGARAHVNARGYRGGPAGLVNQQDGQQGEGLAGFGPAGVVGGQYNSTIGLQAENSGGGGMLVTGAGGGHSAAGQDAEAFANGWATPEGGAAYGVTSPDVLTLGGGGAGVWHGSYREECTVTPDRGGRGGGVLAVFAASAEIKGRLAANGENGLGTAAGTNLYGAGGGAGGTVLLTAETLTITGALQATAGRGVMPPSCGYSQRRGGDGSPGRVKVRFNVLNGQPQGSASATSQLLLVTDPPAELDAPPP